MLRITDYIGVLPSAARTTTQTSAVFTNEQHRGVKVVLDITAASSPSLVVTIDGFDPVSGVYFTLLTSAAKTGTGTTILTVYPGLTAATNVTVSDVLPSRFRIVVTAGNGNSATYTVGASLLP